MRKAVEQENKRRKETSKINMKENKKIQFNVKLDKKQRIALIVGVLFVILIILINNYTALGLVLNKNISSDDAVQVELQTSNNKLIPFNNEILVYNKGTIISYNSYGKQTGKITLEDTIEADINTSGKYIQVINKDKGVIYVYKNKYETARIKIEGEVYSGCINSDGTSVIEYSSNGNKMELGVYNNSGDMKYKIKLSNKIIGKYTISDNSKYLAYVDVNIRGISVQTNINLIDLSSIKEDETNAVTVYTEDNSLAYDIYWTGKNIVARFDECYMIYNTVLNKIKTVPISKGQILSVGDYNKKYAYIGIDEGGKYVLNMRKMSSDSVKIIPIEDVPKYFVYEDGLAYVCYGKNIEVYNNLGMKIKNYNSDMVITEPVIFNNGRSAVMSISNKLIMFTI